MNKRPEKSNSILEKWIYLNPNILQSRLLMTFVVYLFAFTQCTNNSVTGGGTEDVNTISGILYSQENTVVAEARITLLPSNHNPVGKFAGTTLLRNSETDKNGKFFFKNVGLGKFNLEAMQLDNNKLALYQNVEIQKGQKAGTFVQKIVLEEPGNSLIYLPDSILAQGGYVFIPGTRIYMAIDDEVKKTGILKFSALPPGNYTSFNFVDTLKASESIVLQDSIRINSGKSTPVYAFDQVVEVVVNTSASGAGIKDTLIDFPLLIKLDGSTTDFNRAGEGGVALTFRKKDGTRLNHEISYWNSQEQLAEVWVKMDSLFGGVVSQSILMEIRTDMVPAQNLDVIFDTSQGYVGVYHFDSLNSGNWTGYADASNNGNHVYSSDLLSRGNIQSSWHGNGLQLNGANQFAETSKNYTNPQEFSFSLWFKSKSQKGGILLDFTSNLKADVVDSGGEFDRRVWMDSLGGIHYGIFQDWPNVGSQIKWISSKEKYNDDRWHYVAAVGTRSGIQFWIDNQNIGKDSSANRPANFTGHWKVGYGKQHLWPNKAASPYFEGMIDEVHISHRGRSPDWFKMAYLNQLNSPGFMIFRLRR